MPQPQQRYSQPVAPQRTSAAHRRVTNATVLGLIQQDTIMATIVPHHAPPAMPALVPQQQLRTAHVEVPSNQPSRAASAAARVTVSAYRLLGFSILTLIVVVLIGYIAQTAFFFLSHSWAMPVQISASDDKVVGLQTALSAQKNGRDKLASDLAQADLAIAAEQRFQLEFVKSIRTDLANRKAELDRFSALAGRARSAGGAIASTNASFAAASRRKAQAEYNAGLIDRTAMATQNFQDANISGSTLGLAEREAELEERATELEIQTDALDAVLNDKASETALSYDVLKVKRDFDNSRLALDNDLTQREAIKSAIARQDEIIASLTSSAYLRAVTDKAIVAFVPYSNLTGVKAGTKLYRCKLAMVLCHSVGSVLAVLPGEVSFKHPHRDQMVRGQMTELRLDSGEEIAVQDDVLFMGSKPLGF